MLEPFLPHIFLKYPTDYFILSFFEGKIAPKVFQVLLTFAKIQFENVLHVCHIILFLSLSLSISFGSNKRQGKMSITFVWIKLHLE